MSTSSSRCRMRCCRWSIGTVAVCTPGSSRPARRRSARSPPIRDISARRSASSASSTPGDRPCVRHPHVHCVVPAGGLSPDHQRWIRPEVRRLLPAGEGPQSRLSREVCRGAPARLHRRSELDLAGATEDLRDPTQWHAFVDALFQTDWVVYAKPAFGGASGRAPLPRALHASRRHQQSSIARLRRRPRHLPVEGLRARQSARAR